MQTHDIAYFESRALAWLAAFNEKNLAALLRLYAPHSIHVSPKLRAKNPDTKGMIQGHAQLATWWQDAFERLPSLTYCLSRLTFGPTHVFIEYVRKVDGEEQSDVAELLEFKEGLISYSRVFLG